MLWIGVAIGSIQAKLDTKPYAFLYIDIIDLVYRSSIVNINDLISKECILILEDKAYNNVR